MRIKSKFKLKKLFRAMLLIVVSLFLVAFFFRGGIILDHLGFEINIPFI